MPLVIVGVVAVVAVVVVLLLLLLCDIFAQSKTVPGAFSGIAYGQKLMPNGLLQETRAT